MTKASKVNSEISAAEELERLNAFHAEQVRALQPRLEDERQAKFSEQRKAEAEALASKKAEAAEIAKYLVEEVSPKADKLVSELVRTLIERRDLGRELARFKDVAQIGNQIEYAANHEIASRELLDLWGRRHTGRSERHQTYAEMDARIVHNFYLQARDAA